MKTETTCNVEIALFHKLKKMGTFICFEVGIGKEIVDCLTWNTKNEWYCYEIKTTYSDFKSKAAKTFIGNFNYFVMTQDVYEKAKNQIPSDIGVYVYSSENPISSLSCEKKAKRLPIGVDEKTLYYSLIKSFSRENDKILKEKTFKKTKNAADYVRILKSELKRLQGYEKQYIDLATQVNLSGRRNFISIHKRELERYKEIEKEYIKLKQEIKNGN